MKIEQILGRILKEKELKIAAAESFTGGLFAKRLTDISGSSAYFIGGIVCYSNFAKKNLLKVPDLVIKTYGAVSNMTAKIMAENVKEILLADIGVSFTGVAGPTTEEQKPVGLAFIGIAINDETVVYKNRFTGTREEIRDRAVTFAIEKIIEKLGGKK